VGGTQKRPRCPRHFTPEQRSQWFNILNRLEERDLLSCTPEGNVRALAVYQADFQALDEFINLHGTTHTEARRPYQCPACKGSAVQAPAKRKAAAGDAKAERSTPSAARQRCSVCRKRNREQIDAALLKGVPLRQLVEQSGTSVGALHRHKMQCLKVKPAAAPDRPCKGCKGTGVIQGGHVTYQYPEVARRDIAATMVARLSASLGLDNMSLAKLKGVINKPESPGGLRDMMKHRAKLR
jgi:phage terminase small subunit